MNCCKHLTWLLLLLSTLLHATAIFGANITAEVSRNPVSIDESFELVFTAEDSVDAEPDFSPLERDFQILQRSQNQSIQMINGHYSRNTRWLLSLMAKRAGNLQIPAIAFGSDRSQPLKLQVREAPQTHSDKNNDDIFLEVSLEPQEAYIQQQLTYRVRLFRSANVIDANLSEPTSSDPDTIFEQLGDEQSYETRHKGKRYLVNEINYAIFPQNAGPLTLEPVIFQARLLQQQSRGHRSPFNVFNQAGPLKRWRSKAVNVTVKPAADTMGDPWLPAVAVHLSESWPQDEPEFRVGEPVTRTLRLQALGATSSQLPSINTKVPDGFKQYPDKPVVEDHKSRNGITGLREEKIALVPTATGRFILPAIDVAWWNTETDRLEKAHLPERHIEVLPALGGDKYSPTTQLATAPSTASPASEQPLAHPAIVNSEVKEKQHFPYHWLSLFLAIGWLATAATWWLYSRKPASQRQLASNSPHRDTRQPRQALNKLKQACEENNAPAAGTALLEWGEALWPDMPPRNLSEIAKRLEDDVAVELKRLERALYGKDTDEWKGRVLWEAIKDYKPVKKHQAESGNQLLSLYPN